MGWFALFVDFAFDLARAREHLREQERREAWEVPSGMPPPQQESRLTPEQFAREYIWPMAVHHFPGGLAQFEHAVKSGYVRWEFNGPFTFSVHIGPPPASWRPQGATGDQAPPPTTNRTADAIAGAYKALGFKLRDTPTPQEVKDRYRELARRHHPDKHRAPAAAARATERMAKVNPAYELLKNEERAL